MKNFLLLACASIALTMAASVCSADDGRYYDNGGYYGDGYYDNGDNSWRYQNQDYGNYGNYDNRGYGYNPGIVSPRWIVRDLRQRGYSDISRPVLAGRLYQVKARDVNGHKTKLYIDAYTGRIVKAKG